MTDTIIHSEDFPSAEAEPYTTEELPGLADGFLQEPGLSAQLPGAMQLRVDEQAWEIKALQQELQDVARAAEKDKALLLKEIDSLKTLTHSTSGKAEETVNSAIVNANIGLLILLLVLIAFGAWMGRNYMRRLAGLESAPLIPKRSPSAPVSPVQAAQEQVAEESYAYAASLEDGEPTVPLTADDLFTESAEDLVQQGLPLLKEQQYEQAISLFTIAIGRDATCADAYFNRGAAYAMQGNYAEAITDFDATLALYPDHGNVYFNRGIAHLNRGSHMQALADLNTALEKGFSNPMLYMHRGTVLLKLGHAREAITDYEVALQHFPNAVEVNINLGLALMKEGRMEEAAGRFRHVVDISPEFAEAHFHLATAAAALGLMEEAVLAAQRAVQLKPELRPAITKNAALKESLEASI